MCKFITKIKCDGLSIYGGLTKTFIFQIQNNQAKLILKANNNNKPSQIFLHYTKKYLNFKKNSILNLKTAQI